MYKCIDHVSISFSIDCLCKAFCVSREVCVCVRTTLKRCGCNYFSFTILGFYIPQYLKFCILTKSSKENNIFLMLNDFNKWLGKLKPILVIVLTNLLQKLNFLQKTLQIFSQYEPQRCLQIWNSSERLHINFRGLSVTPWLTDLMMSSASKLATIRRIPRD